MNICTLDQKTLKLIMVKYVELLVKCEMLQNKLEKLYEKLSTNSSKYLRSKIVKVNKSLNLVMINIMNYQTLLSITFVPTVA